MIVGNPIPAGLPRILVSAEENIGLFRFAAICAKTHAAALLNVFVQSKSMPRYAHLSRRSREVMSLANDGKAQRAFRSMRQICAAQNVPVLQMYVLYDNPGELLLDYAATWGVEAMIIGTTRKSQPLLATAGPVVRAVYQDLPASIPLLIHA